MVFEVTTRVVPPGPQAPFLVFSHGLRDSRFRVDQDVNVLIEDAAFERVDFSRIRFGDFHDRTVVAQRCRLRANVLSSKSPEEPRRSPNVGSQPPRAVGDAPLQGLVRENIGSEPPAERSDSSERSISCGTSSDRAVHGVSIAASDQFGGLGASDPPVPSLGAEIDRWDWSVRGRQPPSLRFAAAPGPRPWRPPSSPPTRSGRCPCGAGSGSARRDC